ncbi:MAG: hypothetical protein EA359_01355 [Balneolaceae bacterium]|nr:MAG: hypothetical protein EA359_01355 [Balneolaceae bacterium]
MRIINYLDKSLKSIRKLNYELSVKNRKCKPIKDGFIRGGRMYHSPADICADIESTLQDHILELWYPDVLDFNNGGYHSSFSNKWKLTQEREKFVVSQARHLWFISHYYLNNQKNENLESYANHGYQFLRDHFLDNEHNGFYSSRIDLADYPIKSDSGIKDIYCNSFCIFALAEYYKAFGDEDALNLSISTFYWILNTAYIEKYGSYLRYVGNHGEQISKIDQKKISSYLEPYIRAVDYDSVLHLFEAFISLYRIWPDKLLRSKIEELFNIISNRLINKQKNILRFYQQDWKPLPIKSSSLRNPMNGYSNYFSFGHDLQTAFLLFQAARILDFDENNIIKKIRDVCDHVLNTGWDKDFGGIYMHGVYEDNKLIILNRKKAWWVQAEALPPLLLLAMKSNDREKYCTYFLHTWAYIQNYLIDHVNKGWFFEGYDQKPDAITGLKANIWKTPYHTGRALVWCLSVLQPVYAEGSMKE